MHTEQQLKLESLTLVEDGRPSSIHALLPGWDLHDRFGVIVTEPFGALGASLLIQTAVGLFYDTDPSRGELASAQYPDIYLFHVGGHWGDHSSFDFWPPRKEVFCPAEPVGVLEALNDRAITRLALPAGPLGDLEDLAVGPSTWAEQGSFRGRIRSCFEYNASGDLEAANLVLSTLDSRYDQNAAATLDPGSLARDIEARGGIVPQHYLVGPSRVADIDRYNEIVGRRTAEIDPATLSGIRDRWRAGRAVSADGTARTERYTRISAEQALARIAGIAGSQSF